MRGQEWADTTGKDFSRVKPILDLTAAVAGNAVCCGVTAYATQRATTEMLPGLRQKPSPLTREPLPGSFWKHADDQTVVGMAAVFQAIQRHGLDPGSFRDWGVIAAPRFLGRAALAIALNRFALEGAWGISPHLIPHRSLHSISGTVSQALKIHGPNFGVGGGPNAAAEALAVAGGLIADERLPGVWVVMTGYDPEMAPSNPADPEGGALAATRPVAGAVALALVRQGFTRPGLRLRICAGLGQMGAPDPAAGKASWPMFSFETLLEVLADERTPPAACWRLRAGWVALESAKAGAENSL
jgi:hypothetical protein